MDMLYGGIVTTSVNNCGDIRRVTNVTNMDMCMSADCISCKSESWYCSHSCLNNTSTNTTLGNKCVQTITRLKTILMVFYHRATPL